MTREELNKKKVLLSLNNKKYEKVAHSGTENFLAYRKKVLEGRAKMDALKRQSEMFNVTEANDKHYNDLVNNGMLIHAQNPLYGQQRDNTKYYKREGEPGKYRYYYTKEEYDAAHKTGASSDAEREAQARQQYETNKKIENYKNQNKQETGEAKELGKYEFNQAMNAEIKKFSDVAREGGAAAVSKKMLDEGYADDLLYVVKKGLQSGKLTYKNGRFETDDPQLRADIEEESSFLQKRSREVGELSGKGKDIQKELEKLIISKIEDLNEKNEKRKKNVETIEKSNDKTLNDDVKHSDLNTDNTTAETSTSKQENETTSDESLEHFDSNPNTITTSEPLTPEQEYLNFKAKVEAGMKKQETIRHSMFIKSAKKQETPKPIKPVYDNNKFDFYENVKKFKEEHPNVLSHSQNFKYYNKIDLGNGKSRYFYTKAEWDAYQNGLGQQKKQEQEKTIKKNAEAAAHEGDRYAKKPLPKSATMTDAERKQMYEDLAKNAKIHNQQIKNYENNKKAAEAEGERMAQKYAAMNSSNSKDNKKPSDISEKSVAERIEDLKADSTDYVKNNAERINNEYNKAREDEHNVSLQIDEKYGFNKAKTDEDLNKCWDTLVRDMYKVAQNIDNPDKCQMNFWSDENGAGWDIYIPEYEKWAQEYQKEIDSVFNKAFNATNYDEKTKYGDQWEAMNEELRVRSLEAQTKTLKMLTKLKKELLK